MLPRPAPTGSHRHQQRGALRPGHNAGAACPPPAYRSLCIYKQPAGPGGITRNPALGDLEDSRAGRLAGLLLSLVVQSSSASGRPAAPLITRASARPCRRRRSRPRGKESVLVAGELRMSPSRRTKPAFDAGRIEALAGPAAAANTPRTPPLRDDGRLVAEPRPRSRSRGSRWPPSPFRRRRASRRRSSPAQT